VIADQPAGLRCCFRIEERRLPVLDYKQTQRDGELDVLSIANELQRDRPAGTGCLDRRDRLGSRREARLIDREENVTGTQSSNVPWPPWSSA